MKGVLKGVSSMVNALKSPKNAGQLYEAGRKRGVVNNRRQLANALYQLARAGEISKNGDQYGPGTSKQRGSSGRLKRKAPGAAETAPRWALTNDGAFMLIDHALRAIEIPKAAAAALVEFVRTLDKGEA